MPLTVTALVFTVRWLKLGYPPVAANAIVPALACFAGVALGLALAYGAWKTALTAAAALAAAALWAWNAGPPAEVIDATEARLRRLVATAPAVPPGDHRFAALVRTAFADPPDGARSTSAADHNRAAIFALGIALGDERLAPLVGLAPDAEFVREAAGLRNGTTLRGRADWARHYSLSAALALLRHPFVSDAAGLIKEQLDALTRDSGFSFADLAADRAGVRFAAAATHSETAAAAMQARLEHGFGVADFFPPVDDLPENLTVEEFRRRYGGVGDARYRRMLREIDARLEACAGLGPAHP
jgi:hypothetical protein